jgi:hypothetical protein
MGVHCTKRNGDCSSGSDIDLCGHGICIDQHQGSRGFTCLCNQGWKTDGNNPACNLDVNECDTGRAALCSSVPPVICINTPGSYMCGPCPNGWTGNGHRCMDVNECAIGNGGCSMNPMVQCINTPVRTNKIVTFFFFLLKFYIFIYLGLQNMRRMSPRIYRERDVLPICGDVCCFQQWGLLSYRKMRGESTNWPKFCAMFVPCWIFRDGDGSSWMLSCWRWRRGWFRGWSSSSSN